MNVYLLMDGTQMAEARLTVARELLFLELPSW
jgi:hypothetical protein